MTSPVRPSIPQSLKNRHQLHGLRCRCSTQSPISPQIEALTAENIILRNRIEQGDKRRTNDTLQYMQNENRKLHQKIRKYQETIEQLQSAHQELVDMIKQNNSIPTSKRNDIISRISNQSIEGQYLISFKRLNQNPEQKNHFNQKQPTNIQHPTLKKQSLYNSNKNKKNDSPNSSQKTPQKIKQDQLSKSLLRIKALEVQVQQKIKLKSAYKSLQNQNSLLRQKIKSIERSLKTYEDSIKYYEIQVSKLKNIIEQFKSKDNNNGVTIRQNLSLKQSNEYLRKQIEQLQQQIQNQQSEVLNLRDENEAQNQKNIELTEECSKLTIFAEEIQKQKKTMLLLNEELESKTIELGKQQQKNQKHQSIHKQMLEIKSSLQQLDLSCFEKQQHKFIIENKQTHIELNKQISLLHNDLQKYRQQILMLEQKVISLTAQKQIICNELDESQKSKIVLLEQIKNLSNTIDKYLEKEDNLPSVKVTDEQNKEIQTKGTLSLLQQSINKIVIKLNSLEQRLTTK